MHRDGRAARELVARYGDRLENLMALARGTSDAKQSARTKASALRHEILGLDAELALRCAPERTPLQVCVHTRPCLCVCVCVCVSICVCPCAM